MQLNPKSREYFDLRLFAVMMNAAHFARDEFLLDTFSSAAGNLGSKYSCGGKDAMIEGKELFEKIIRFYEMNVLRLATESEKGLLAQSFLSTQASEADISGLRALGESNLAMGMEGATKEGIDALNKAVRERLDEYKKFKPLQDWL